MTTFTLSNVCGLTEDAVPYGIFDTREQAVSAMVAIVTNAGTIPGRIFRKTAAGDVEVTNERGWVISTWVVRPTIEGEAELVEFLNEAVNA